MSQQRQQFVADEVPPVGRVGVGLVGPPFQAAAAAEGFDPLAPNLQQRPDEQQAAGPRRPAGGNARQPAEVRAANDPLEDRLNVVVGVMADGNGVGPALRRHGGEEVVPQAASVNPFNSFL